MGATEDYTVGVYLPYRSEDAAMINYKCSVLVKLGYLRQKKKRLHHAASFFLCQRNRFRKYIVNQPACPTW